MNQPLNLDEYETAARVAARIGSGINPAAVLKLATELRRTRTELAAARSQTLAEVEAEIAAAIDRNRAEHPDSEPMIARRLGMRAAERIVRGLREDAIESHVVADNSDDPEHADDCPGCESARPAAGGAR